MLFTYIRFQSTRFGLFHYVHTYSVLRIYRASQPASQPVSEAAEQSIHTYVHSGQGVHSTGTCVGPARQSGSQPASQPAKPYIPTYMRTHTHTHIHKYIRTLAYVHTYIDTYIHTYVRTYIDTYSVQALPCLGLFYGLLVPASQPPCCVRMKPASEASKPAWIDRAKCQPPKMQLRLFLLPVSLSPTSQILVPQSSQQPLLAITYIHIYIHTHNGMSQSLQGSRALPESSGVHMYVHNAPSGVPACTHTYIHTYIDKGYIWGGARGDHF